MQYGSCPVHGYIKRRGTERKSGSSPAPRRSAPLRSRSSGGAERESFLRGVKLERLRVQPFCEDCGKPLTRENSDLHHVEERTKDRGFRLNDGEPRIDEPTNLRLLCRKCHKRYKPGLQWSAQR